MRRTGHIYFARCNDFVKIGFATDYAARVAAISANCPYDIEIVAVHEGTIADERRFHKHLAPFHHKREWFRWCDEVRAIALSGLPRIAATLTAPALALDEARRKFGGDTGLAEALGGISPQAVSQWKRAPALRVLDIERVSGVPCYRLRPDVYPAPEAAA